MALTSPLNSFKQVTTAIKANLCNVILIYILYSQVEQIVELHLVFSSRYLTSQIFYDACVGKAESKIVEKK